VYGASFRSKMEANASALEWEGTGGVLVQRELEKSDIGAYSGGIRQPIPIDSGHRFRDKPASL
jgi:hypothetical protein